VPLFVFDGKAPAEKKELLEKRLLEKKEAEKEFKQLETNLVYNSNMDDEEKHEIINKMDILKKKFVSISKNEIMNVKMLIKFYGMTYCNAEGEADELCAMFVNKGFVWGCLSEDMDMFLYGCPRVLRYLSLINHTFVLYETKKILCKLEISQNELCELCVISGTDYNLNTSAMCDFYTTLKYFKKYKKHNNHYEDKKNSFYDWLITNTNYIVDDYEFFRKNCSMFESNDYLKHFENTKIVNKNIEVFEIRELLKKDGFIFVK
jgi:5'-3' exonuclease